jgi:hypothetical protein
MGFFKDLDKKIKQDVGKLNNKLNELESVQSVRHENDYRIMFEDIKNKKLFSTNKLIKAFKFEKTITKDVCNKKVKQFEIYFNELEKKVKDGEITYTEFFNKWKKR